MRRAPVVDDWELAQFDPLSDEYEDDMSQGDLIDLEGDEWDFMSFPPVGPEVPYGCQSRSPYPRWSSGMEEDEDFSPHRGREWRRRPGHDHSRRQWSSQRHTRKEPPKFSGKGEVKEYLIQFQICSQINHWSYGECGEQLATSLTDDAQEVLTAVPRGLTADYDALSRQLLHRFGLVFIYWIGQRIYLY